MSDKSIDIESMTIRQVMEITKYMTIREGGITYMFEKLVLEIEKLQKMIDTPK